MPFIQPGRGDVHVDRPLTNLSLAFTQEADSFVADKVFPNIPVSNRSDEYYTYDRGEFNRDEMEKRAPGTQSAGGGYTIGTDNYSADVWGYHKDIHDQVRNNADASINLEREAVDFVTHKAMIKREVLWTATYFADSIPGAIWTFAADGSSARSGSFDPTDVGDTNNKLLGWASDSSTPIEDVREGKRYVQAATGFRPNVMTCSRGVFDRILDHPDIVGRLDAGQTPGGPAMVNKGRLAALFEIDEILVMDAIQNTANKGATNAHSFIGGDHALLSYRPPNPGLMTPSAGYTFSWTGQTGATVAGSRIKRFRMEPEGSDRVEIEMAFDQKLVSADLGYFFADILDTA